MADPIVVSILIFVSGAALVAGAFWVRGRSVKEIESGAPSASAELKPDRPVQQGVATAPAPDSAPVSAASSAPAAPPKASATYEGSLSKTRDGLWGRLQGLWTQNRLDFVEVREQFEEVLYTADIGPRTTERLLERMDRDWKTYQSGGMESFRQGLKNEMLSILGEGSRKDLNFSLSNPDGSTLKIWLVVGINGAGKTTTIGKLSHRLASGGHRVLVAAGDTFRAAAGSQLKTWTERAQVDIFEGAGSPSGVAFDAVQKAVAEKYTALIIDTAGRLHTNKPLMDELAKTKRVIEKAGGRPPDETLIVLDANAGQNALVQARQLHDAIGATAIVVTKLDGTAKGGIVLGIVNELKLPICLLGIGEKIEDLVPFEVDKFVGSVIGSGGDKNQQ